SIPRVFRRSPIELRFVAERAKIRVELGGEAANGLGVVGAGLSDREAHRGLGGGGLGRITRSNACAGGRVPATACIIDPLASTLREPAVAEQPAEPTAVAGEAGRPLAMLDRSGAVTRRTSNRISGSHWHQWRQLWKHGPRVSKAGELRVWQRDNLEI